MTPLTPPYRALPRSVRELILRDLARQTRTLKGIAERHHVPVDAVTALRNDFGPGPVELLTAAEELARPQKPAPKPVATSPELDASERKECRAWALTTGRTTASTGPLPHAIVNAWIEAGRPIAEAPPTPAPAPAADPVEEEEVPAEQPVEEAVPADDDHHGDDPALAVADGPYCATCGDAEVIVRDGKVTACACSPEDEVVDAPIVCGACGEPLPDPTADGCPYCDAEFERVQADKHAEWSEFYVQCLTIPELATECEAVAAAVYRLRDAHAEHLHREQLIMRVQDAIKPHLHLTLNQVRLVLDAIEAA